MPNKNVLKYPITDKADIKKLLPHREPMIMVDGLNYFDGSKAISVFTILDTNMFVENNRLSETGLIEHMAQSSALFTGYANDIKNLPVKEGFIATIKNLKIEWLPRVEDIIATEVTITFNLENMTYVTIVSMLQEQKIASADMILVLKENNS